MYCCNMDEPIPATMCRKYCMDMDEPMPAAMCRKLQAELHTRAQSASTNDTGHATTKATKGIQHCFSTRMVHQVMDLECRD